MKKEEKARRVDELKEELSHRKGFWITDFTGLSVEAMMELRRKLRDNSFSYRVMKKSIFERVLQKLEVKASPEWIEGSVGICVGDDIILGSRLLTDFQRNKRGFKIKGCWFDSRSLSSSEIREVTLLPGRDALITRFLTTLNFPIYSLVQVLQALLTNLVQVLTQIKEDKNGREKGPQN